MDTGRWLRVRAVLERALELEGAQRDECLARECAGDTELRREVESLLANDALTAGLEPPDRSAVARAFGDASEGARVGPYVLERRLGEGGMGAVFLARRVGADFEQEVAVKLIKRGMDTDDILRQFHRERAVLSSLQHACIARLFDGGATEDGRPWFAMERVAGQPIDAWCAERSLSTRERVALFLRVCSAVQHAHQRLVVHRDLKPSNMLVTSDGTPKLLDFGIAKVLAGEAANEATLTLAAERRLTPDYASPEQLRGEPVTTATDVYSLGVVLCELLAGVHPFRGASNPVAARSTPPKASTLLRRAAHDAIAQRMPAARELDSDLDTIVLTALAPEVERRYPSVDALAADLQRYIDGLPIAARPATFGYRLRKYVARNRVAVATSAIVFVALAVGLAAARAGYVEAVAQRNLARERERDAERQSQRAAAVLQLTQSMLAAASPHDLKFKDYTLRQLLDDFAPKIDAMRDADPEVEASVRQIVGEAYQRVGLLDAAGKHLERALALRTQAWGELAPETIGSRIDWINLLHDRGDFAEAEALASRLIDDAEKRADDVTLLVVLTSRGELRDHLGHSAEAEADLRRALALARAVEQPARERVLSTLNALGKLMTEQRHFDEARTALDEALELARRVFGAQSSATATVLAALGTLDRERGDLDASDDRLHQALAIDEALQGPKYYGLASTIDNLGVNAIARGNYAQAVELLRRSSGIARETLGPRHATLATSLSNLGQALEKQGDFAGAEDAYREALAIRTDAFGEEHADTARTLNVLANVLQKRGKFEEAESAYARALATRRKLLGDHSIPVASTLSALSGVQMMKGEMNAAEESAREAVEIYRVQVGPVNSDLAASISNLANVLEQLKRRDEAIDLLREALSMQEQLLDAHHPQLARALTNLGQTMVNASRFDEARPLLERSLAIHREKPNETRLTLSRTLSALALIAQNDGDPQRAEERIREAFESAHAVWGDKHPQTREAARQLADMLDARGDADGAAQLRKQFGFEKKTADE